MLSITTKPSPTQEEYWSVGVPSSGSIHWVAIVKSEFFTTDIKNMIPELISLSNV